MIRKVRLCGKLCVNLHSVAVEDTSCTTRLLAKLGSPTRASNKTRPKLSTNV